MVRALPVARSFLSFAIRAVISAAPSYSIPLINQLPILLIVIAPIGLMAYRLTLGAINETRYSVIF
jgi:hypothetical protein